MKKTALATVLLMLQFHSPAYANATETAATTYKNSDYAAAFAQWQPLAAQGNAEAQYHLAMMYDEGQGTARNSGEALNWFRKAAEQGFDAAQYALGTKYLNGQGVASDEIEALNWFRRLMEPKAPGLALSPYAQLVIYDLGAKYVEDRDTRRNYAETLTWLRKAADRGNPFAQYCLGVMYERGQGVEQNTGEAAKRLASAAADGVAGAQNALASLYRHGKGIPESPVVAYALFDLAAANPSATQKENAHSAENLRALTETLNADEIQTARYLKNAMSQPGNFSRALEEYLRVLSAKSS